MVKKFAVIVGMSLIVIAGVGSGVWYLKAKTKSTLVSPVEPPTNPAVNREMLTWDDPAGFTFQYPKGLVVNKHDEDQDNYAHVELTDSSHSGGIIVWAKDTTAADVTAWVSTEKTFAGASVLDTMLGNQPAKKILLSTPQKKIVVGTVYDELLFSVEAELGEGDYWSKVQQVIVDSFTFKPVGQDEGTSASTGDSAAGGAVDEEEVIE